MKKILIIRFSSIGDVLQTLSVVDVLKESFPDSEIHIATQSRFTPFFEGSSSVTRVWTVDKKSGLRMLYELAKDMSREGFTHIYDSHNNLRSRVLVHLLRLLSPRFKFLRRPVYRWKRLLLFKFRINLFPPPFSGQMDQIRPLKKWNVNAHIPKRVSLELSSEIQKKVMNEYVSAFSSKFIALAPSAAYELKRWPLEYWKRLIDLLPNEKFILLGGPEDIFLEELHKEFPSRVLNLAGKLSLMESAAVVSLSQALVSNDTGVMHMAEQLNHPCIALMGPAPFGFPSKPSTLVLERHLWCRPCSKHGQGPCVNENYQLCLRDISAMEVKTGLKGIMQ